MCRPPGCIVSSCRGTYTVLCIFLLEALIVAVKVYSHIRFTIRSMSAGRLPRTHEPVWAVPKGLGEERTRIVRVLITIVPRMYRESLALTVKRHHPDFEVMLGNMASLDVQAESFRPHLLVRNDTDGADLESMPDMQGVLCWIEILYSDSMGARISLDGEVWEIKDISTEDLLGIVDRTQRLIPEGAPYV